MELLVGRERELDQLTAFALAAQDRGGGLLLRGPAGIGKSFVLAALSDQARSHGFHQLTISGIQSEARLAFAGLHQLVRPVLDRATDLPPRQRDALLSAFGMTDVLAPDPYLIALAVLELLALTATRAPVLAIVDDAQWLDRPTADALAFVVRRLGDDRVAFVVCARDGYETPFDTLGLPVIELGPLDHERSAALLDQRAPHLDERLRARVLNLARGNPLALTELASARPQHGSQHGTGAEVAMTARLERAFTSRYVELPEAVRTLLLVAAAGDTNDLRELVVAADLLLPGTAADPDLWKPAVDAQLVTVWEHRVEFRHPLVRSAIYQGAGTAQRVAVHTALATSLEASPDRRVWHRAAATLGPDEDVAAEIEAAADRAEARGGQTVTLEALERSAVLTPDLGRRAERFLRAAELALELGDPEAATRLSRLAQADALSPRSRARLRLLSEMLSPSPSSTAGVAAKADELIDVADVLFAQGDADLALRFAHLAAQQTWVTDVGQELRSAVLATAERVAPSTTDPVLLSVYSLTDPIGHNKVLIARSGDLVPHDIDAHTAHLVATALNFAGAFALSAPFSSAAATTLRAEGRLRQLVVVSAQQAWSAFPPLDWAVAVPAADETLRLARETGQPLWEASALIVQAMLAGVRGEFDESAALVGAAEAIALPMGANAMLCGLQLTRGLAAIGASSYDEAYEQLHRLFDPHDPAYHHFQSAWALGDLAEAAAHTGNVEAARAHLDSFAQHAQTGESTWTQVALLYARPLLVDDDRAEAAFRGALHADLSTWPLYRARLLLGYGRWLRRQRRAAESRAPLRSAREAFDALGARAFAEQARAELRAAGERSQGAETHAWQRLSPQELQIAQLAADGLSNREIGTRLYLSHRTVASHLYRVYPKLGITTRVQLRPALEQLV
ncbi:ATP-binding protein [Cellulomonas sp. ICMP 17802]|uniref:ATP-binding protein n=1 Tax=Cellulomonas sp. ICMP 17802 TaxID=3239199 RepID=UPI00351B7558